MKRSNFEGNKKLRQEQAQQRKLDRERLTNKDQICVLHGRPGKSDKELARLEGAC